MLDFSRPNRKLDKWLDENVMGMYVGRKYAPRYSDSIAKAWILVNVLSLDFSMQLEHDREYDKWRCRFNGDKDSFEWDESFCYAPLAICKAVYHVVTAMKENDQNA